MGAVVAQGSDNAEALRLVRPGIDVAVEYQAREDAGRGEDLDEGDLYDDVRPALSALRQLGVRVVIAGNQTVRAADLLRGLDLPADLIVTSGEWGVAKPDPAFFQRVVEVAQAGPGCDRVRRRPSGQRCLPCEGSRPAGGAPDRSARRRTSAASAGSV